MIGSSKRRWRRSYWVPLPPMGGPAWEALSHGVSDTPGGRLWRGRPLLVSTTQCWLAIGDGDNREGLGQACFFLVRVSRRQDQGLFIHCKPARSVPPADKMRGGEHPTIQPSGQLASTAQLLEASNEQLLPGTWQISSDLPGGGTGARWLEAEQTVYCMTAV